MDFHHIALWVGFNVFVLALMALDLFAFHRKPHDMTVKEALIMSSLWVSLALAFNVGIYMHSGRQPALEFFTGYLIELSLSVDNLFVFILIFSYFKVPPRYQREVLFWGILGALVMRAAFIVGGVALVKNVHWIIYVFGAFLIYTGIKMALDHDKEIHPENNIVLKWFHKIMPVTRTYEGGKFFVMIEGRRWATPLFVVLLVVELTDLIFNLDSIPAILAITQDPFIVYTSNVFAILGLRAIYFALAGMIHFFHYLHFGLAAILVFVGAKMMLSDIFEIPIGLSLGIVALLLVISVAASMVFPKKDPELKKDNPHHA